MRSLTKSALFGATLLATAGFASAQSANIQNAEALDPDASIVENAMKVQNFSTLVAAVEAAGLGEVLMGPGPFTVFAPLDSAFAALPEGTVDTLLMPENREQLVGLLQSHVVGGVYTSNDIERAFLAPEGAAGDPTDVNLTAVDDRISLDTLAGTQIVIEKVGDQIYVTGEPVEGQDTDDAAIAIVAADIVSSNGVIHAIDGVIMPETSMEE